MGTSPRTPIGTHGAINTRRGAGRVMPETRVRDLDGRLRQVRATGPTATTNGGLRRDPEIASGFGPRLVGRNRAPAWKGGGRAFGHPASDGWERGDDDLLDGKHPDQHADYTGDLVADQAPPAK